MPYTYHIDAERRLVTSIGSGAITRADIEAHQRALLADPAFQPSFSQLADLSGATDSAITRDDLRLVAETSVFDGGSRRAVVAPDPVVFGLSRMFEAFREITGGKDTIRVFKDRNEALRWLLGEE